MLQTYMFWAGESITVSPRKQLKLKELTYVHAEALEGGELKHGPLALLDSDAFVRTSPSDSTSVHAISQRTPSQGSWSKDNWCIR